MRIRAQELKKSIIRGPRSTHKNIWYLKFPIFSLTKYFMKLFILNFQVYHPNNKIYKEEFELHTSKIILRKFPNPKRLVRIYFIVQNRNFPK